MEPAWVDRRVADERSDEAFGNWARAYASLWRGEMPDYDYEDALERLLELLRPNFGDPHMPDAVADSFADSYGDAEGEAQDMVYLAFLAAWESIAGEKMRVFAGADLRGGTAFCVGVDYAGADGGAGHVSPGGRLLFSRSSLDIKSFVTSNEADLRRLYDLILDRRVD